MSETLLLFAFMAVIFALVVASFWIALRERPKPPVGRFGFTHHVDRIPADRVTPIEDM